ncbi:MAG: hypothetical protein NT067_00455 [Candidatus Diapherotrites archaeon]|nr:hypothetical protein [Candidatus Diapherotrites archaeon]
MIRKRPIANPQKTCNTCGRQRLPPGPRMTRAEKIQSKLQGTEFVLGLARHWAKEHQTILEQHLELPVPRDPDLRAAFNRNEKILKRRAKSANASVRRLEKRKKRLEKKQ